MSGGQNFKEKVVSQTKIVLICVINLVLASCYKFLFFYKKNIQFIENMQFLNTYDRKRYVLTNYVFIT